MFLTDIIFNRNRKLVENIDEN